MSESSAAMPWVVVEVHHQLFAIDAAHVDEMLRCPCVAGVPNAPPWLRGVADLRGQVLPLVDLRRRLGWKSAEQEVAELCTLLEQREQDHKNWLAELEASAAENRKFTLATDPHKCAFGKWYDNYKAESQVVASFLRRFDAPHRAIHALAGEVETLKHQNRTQEALALIHANREGRLADLIRLFADLRQLVRESRREIAVVLRRGTRSLAVCVDSVVAVERLSSDAIEPLSNVPGLPPQSLATEIAKRANSGFALVLQPAALIV